MSSETAAQALHHSLSLVFRRMKQIQVEGELPQPERSALAKVERLGPVTSSALAKQEQISPQSMGATLAALESKGLIDRRPDPDDGRRILHTITKAGRKAVQDKRNARVELLAKVLDTSYSKEERAQLLAVAPLLERLASAL